VPAGPCFHDSRGGPRNRGHEFPPPVRLVGSLLVHAPLDRQAGRRQGIEYEFRVHQSAVEAADVGVARIERPSQRAAACRRSHLRHHRLGLRRLRGETRRSYRRRPCATRYAVTVTCRKRFGQFCSVKSPETPNGVASSSRTFCRPALSLRSPLKPLRKRKHAVTKRGVVNRCLLMQFVDWTKVSFFTRINQK
jgi:hypothetical protein